jgi:DNA processing protein
MNESVVVEPEVGDVAHSDDGVHRTGAARSVMAHSEVSRAARSGTARSDVSDVKPSSEVWAAGDQVRLARAGLLRLAEPPIPALVAWVALVGAVAAFDGVIRREAPPEVLAATAARTVGRTAIQLVDMAGADLTAAAEAGATLLCPEDGPLWPESAMRGFDAAVIRGVHGSAPPLALYVRGELPSRLPAGAVTVIGSRASTGYGERVTADIAAGLARAGYTVVSGGAFGIDTVAHRTAVATSGNTVAVLACGIDRSYPTANAGLLRRVALTGAVVSEYPPGTTPAKHRFLVRNRLLGAFSAVTVVVEAGRRSGSLSTASAAAHLGRIVMAVPGPVTSAMSVGCHLLLRDRFALLAADVDDVLAVLRPLQPALFDSGIVRPTDGLDDITLRVYDALPARGATTLHELSVSSGIPGNDVLDAMPSLEMAGLAHRDGGSWVRTRTA